MTILTSTVIYIFSFLIVFFADRSLLKRSIPSLGPVVVLMYGVTYGLGLVLWRLDPSSLFGYGSLSTVGALDALLHYFSIGIFSLATAYGICRVVFNQFQKTLPKQTIGELAWPHRKHLSNLSLVLSALGTFALAGMSVLGLFARSSEVQAQILQESLIAKVIIGTSIVSRLAPIGFVMIPFAWKRWSFLTRFLIIILLSIWQTIAISSGSRGLFISLPVYLVIGALCWQKISFKRLFLGLIVGAMLFLPLAEYVRVHREGNQSVPELKRAFQTFQIGKQLMGTSHEFYFALDSSNCRADLTKQLSQDLEAKIIYDQGVRSFPENSLARWHVVGLYENCSKRVIRPRSFEGFDKLPLGLIPSTLYPDSPTLFDGQVLSEKLSEVLDLKPGEISYSTISLFADSSWRWGWAGVVLAPTFIGALLAVFQSFFNWMQSKKILVGLFAQFLVVTLVCTWINNTILTMIWYLFWDFPKAWLEIILLSTILGSFRLSPRSFSSS